MPEQDFNGVWGVAIIRSILDGVSPNLRSIAFHLGTSSEKLRYAFTSLSLNGIFLHGHRRIYNDRKELDAKDQLAWSYYAGLASGATGNVIQKSSSA